MPLIALGAYTSPTVPDALPVDIPSRWQNLRQTWTGHDGSVWDLMGRDGLCLAAQAVEGLSMPEVDYWATDTPGRHGSVVRGWRVGKREVHWPLFLWSDDSSDDWLARDRAFWSTLHPDRPGWWRVTTPGGSWRELQCRFSSESDDPEVDPVKHGWRLYGITLRADWPYWQGPPISQQFAPPEQRNFFGGGALPVLEWTDRGAATPFWISPSTSVIDTTVLNPGDLPAWPTWRVHAPFAEFGILLDGHEIHWPEAATDFAAATSDHGVEIRTDPANPSVRAFGPDGLGQNLIHKLDRRDFAPVPVAGEAASRITVDGTGWVEVELRPNYLRAW